MINQNVRLNFTMFEVSWTKLPAMYGQAYRGIDLKNTFITLGFEPKYVFHPMFNRWTLEMAEGMPIAVCVKEGETV